jgi:phosphatidylserine/phosphatidylglycerophosphate/cardiolipin synthase-like enzyme
MPVTPEQAIGTTRASTRTFARSRAARAVVALGLMVSLVLGAGCASLPPNVGRVESTAMQDTGDTPLGRVAAASVPATVAKDPAAGDSGFQLIARGEEAFGTLYTLIARARASLDLQYYIVADDPYARTLLRAAREAAARGVRVRLLIDDFYTTGKDDRIAWYSAHDHIEVRVFNPFAGGRGLFATRVAASLTDISRINRRMHNKLFVADNALAVTGGRNVGAEYYQHSDRTNFLDLDVLVAGPVVKDLSDTFDRYWNSAFAYPIETLAEPGAEPTVDARALADPNDPVRKATAEAEELGAAFARNLDAGKLAMIVAPAELIADRPSKIQRTRPKIGDRGLVAGATIATDVLSIASAAQSELIIISPYFVPGERGVQALKALRQRGVRVRVLTNSLAATDAAVVHIGYSKYRKPLIEAGVEIAELRPELGEEKAKLGAFGSSKASLHAKALVVDRKTVFIGSFNVDQRSTLENTEMGLEIENDALPQQILGILRDRGPEGVYRVTLDADGAMRWTTRTDGVEQVYTDEPGVGVLLKLSLKLLAPFAPEQML